MSHVHWGYSKFVIVEDLARLRDEHLVISAAQRAIADDPTNQCRPLRDDEIIKPRAPTGFELTSEYPTTIE